MLLIIFILVAGHWEFSNIEHVNSPINTESYCELLAAGASDSHTRAFCVDDTGVEA